MRLGDSHLQRECNGLNNLLQDPYCRLPPNIDNSPVISKALAACVEMIFNCEVAGLKEEGTHLWDQIERALRKGMNG